MRATFAGGGTGGHLYPAVAIADALVERGKSREQPVDIEFLGARDRLEARIVPAAGYTLRFVIASPLLGPGPIDRVRAVLVNGVGTAAAIPILLRHKPVLLIATGGYVCFPVVMAARMLRAFRLLASPIVLLEINAQPGLTNRMLAPLVDEVWGAYDEAPREFSSKYRATGVPIRASLQQLPDRESAASRLGLDPKKRTFLVMGGSQGARSINDAMLGLVGAGKLPEGWQVLHLSGDGDYSRVSAAYQKLGGANVVVLPFLADPAGAYACADLALARAGAATLAELAAVGLPAILVPYPHASEDHQRVNAQRAERAGAAALIDDGGLNPDSLSRALDTVLHPATLQRMAEAARSMSKPQAIDTILERVHALTGAL
ncbi:MAG: undecaprenyldiphospho-muramoylpentapeptide beta-N-acetylglucosaminyltransferase [Candidatus Eremiobacteraeota bacterium]|nr:undecaprenyldiphospho-muramoylpentapeptide beta-N-acetylglucosaminyltransferase [Candidatus Eremiobacteraeota bacterium]